MTCSKILGAIFLAAAMIFSTQFVIAAPGYKASRLKVEHRAEPLDLHIWYPAQQESNIDILGKNAVFKGITVQRNAIPKSGKHPLVLLSHGSGGNAVNIGWIAAELADQDMVVIATNHPGSTSRHSTPFETTKIWQRPQDLSAIVDHVQKAGLGTLQIDSDRLAAVGFSLGGHTVLSLAGAQVSLQKYSEYCKRYPYMFDCQWFASGGVDFASLNAAHFNQSNIDTRFKAVIAIDPGLSQAFNFGSIQEISVPVKLLNLGVNDQVPAAINASGILPYFNKASLQNIEQATHFSFLGECTKIGESILKSENEEALCSEVGERTRSDIHTELKSVISSFLIKHLAVQ
ncbi:MAG: hypothetical protein ABJN40_17990 [Sneathiella sp.]